jgi:hypothetical protein
MADIATTLAAGCLEVGELLLDGAVVDAGDAVSTAAA